MIFNLKTNGLTDKEIGTSGARNLIPYPYYQTTKTINGIIFTDLGDGRIHAKGTATASATFVVKSNNENWTVNNGTYTISGCPSGGSFSTYRLQLARHVSGTLTSYGNDYGNGATAEITDGLPILIQIVIASGVTIDAVFEPMLERGLVKHDYIPYYHGGAERALTLEGYRANAFRKTPIFIEDATADFNNYTEDGVYYFGASTTLTNAPEGANTGWLEVTHIEGASSLIQTWQERTSTLNATRTKSASTTWRSWDEKLSRTNGGTLNGDLYIKKANSTTTARIIHYQDSVFLRNYTDDNNYKDLVIRTTGLSYLSRENGTGKEYAVLHTGNSNAVAIQSSAPTDTSALWVW